MKYSQNDEQAFITSYFGDNCNGKFLEIGSYHPTALSNTRALVEIGWSGVYVEPSPICFRSFEQEYKDNEKIFLIEAAIGNYDGYGIFYESNGDAISTTNTQHKKKWEDSYPTLKYDEINVKFMSMETLLNQHKNIDFLNLDVEGTNIELFNLIPDYFWDYLKMICIEHDGQHYYIEDKLKNYGFSKININGENIILGKY